MIAAAMKYCQAEKKTPQDFTTDPPRLRKSVLCQKAPKNCQFNGLVQVQDPKNDPNLFFDPTGGDTATRRSQPNTFGTAISTDDEGGGNNSTGNTGNFGSCPVPEVEFGQGFDGRLESSFRPVDQIESTKLSHLTISVAGWLVGRGLHIESYSHGSSPDINIIARVMCDQLASLCNADATARTTCANARASASSDTPKAGFKADIFNPGFNIITNFAEDPVFDVGATFVFGNGTNADGDDENTNGGDNTSDNG